MECGCVVHGTWMCSVEWGCVGTKCGCVLHGMWMCSAWNVDV